MRKVVIILTLAVGIFALVSVSSIWWVVRKVRNSMPDTAQLEKYDRQLEQRFGELGEFIPPLDGVPAVDQIERFSVVREAMYEASRPLATEMDAFAEGALATTGTLRGKLRFAFTSIDEGMHLLGNGVRFMTMADSLLLHHDLGKGEFLHWNAIALAGLFEYDPRSHRDQVPEDAGGAFEDMAGQLSSKWRDVLIEQVENRVGEIERLESPTASQLAQLEADRLELKRCEENDEHIPYCDPIPPSLAAAFAPFERRLRATRPQQPADLFLEGFLVGEVKTEGGGISIRLN